MSLRLGFTRGQTHNLNIVQSIFMLRVVLFFNMSRQLSLHTIKAYLTEADTRPHVLHNQSHMYTDHSVCYMYCVLYHCKLMFSQYKHNLCQAPHKLHNKNRMQAKDELNKPFMLLRCCHKHKQVSNHR